VTIDGLDLTLIFVKEGSVLNKDSQFHDKFMHGIKVLVAKNYKSFMAYDASDGANRTEYERRPG
jgi:hypothetical protein